MDALENNADYSREINSGECKLLGPENILIPPGIYQASYLHHETCGMYSRKMKGEKSRLKGGKVYLWFQIDPYREKLVEMVELYLPYNTTSVEYPFGKGGKFEMTRKTNYYKDHKRLFGVSRDDRISPSAFRGKLIEVKVGTVEITEKQKARKVEDQYSVIRGIIGFTG